MELKTIKGVGEKTEKAFNRAGVYKAEDLIDYYPRYYDTYEAPVLVRDLDTDRTQAVFGTVARDTVVRRVKNLTLTEAFIRDANGDAIKCVWFNAPYLKNQLQIGASFVFRGFVKELRQALVIDQPKMFKQDEYNNKMGSMQPVYPLVRGLTNNVVTKAVRDTLDQISKPEFLPQSIRDKYDLLNVKEAVKQIHFPKNTQEFQIARKRFVFEEFFRFINNLQSLKAENEKQKNTHVIDDFSVAENLINNLPYDLTKAQVNVWNEIKKDMSSDGVMNRLVQGDVGSGKTIVAILGLLSVAVNGYQGAIMAPTEVLAKQHYEGMLELFDENDIDLNVVMLTGSMTAKEKREVYEVIESGKANIIVGTHALIQEAVNYKDLALVVTDEQHRFGVRQREAISHKGENPHVLVMSATPIPRTLAIIMYGDLDISIIDEMPVGRLSIGNALVDTSYRPNAYDFIEKQVQAGRQAYIICPTVEYSEAVEGENVIEYAEKLESIFPPSIKVAYLHGRMKNDEKNKIMDAFAKNDIQVLVSTTVVEVGVNVPNATVMMVENSERFGLAQLHQLRGRVGRGSEQSYCIFVDGSKDKSKKERLQVLCNSNDGFKIANEDLKLRGPGDFFGVRQSGDYEFRMGDILNDADVLKQAADSYKMLMEGELPITEKEKKVLEDDVVKELSI